MPFKDTFNQLKGQLKDLQQGGQKMLSEYQSKHQSQSQPGYPGASQPQYQNQSQPQSQSQSQYQNQPPPIPHGTHPGAEPGSGSGSGASPAIYWQPSFSPSTPVSASWEHKLGNNNGWGNNEIQQYTSEPSNSFHTHTPQPGPASDGQQQQQQQQKLILRAISQPSHPDPARKYTSARLVSRQRLSRARGSLVATLSLPCGLGVWPAFWLLPYEPFTWPTDGEVDVAETWNGDGVNHSCLHWGFYTPQDTGKHRVVGTPVQGMQTGRPVRFEFSWWQDEHSRQGRMVWWIDGRPVMKAPIPQGTRPMADFVVLLNIAMGGNVCQGQMPREGVYDMVVHEMKMLEEPENGGWQKFEMDWARAREGDRI
ncbi:hypothetical protein LTR67_005488 [Exophiala xenobiotica]